MFIRPGVIARFALALRCYQLRMRRVSIAHGSRSTSDLNKHAAVSLPTQQRRQQQQQKQDGIDAFGWIFSSFLFSPFFFPPPSSVCLWSGQKGNRYRQPEITISMRSLSFVVRHAQSPSERMDVREEKCPSTGLTFAIVPRSMHWTRQH